MMTSEQWKALPPLLRRGQVVAVGIKPDVLRDVTVRVSSAADIDGLAYGKVAAVQIGGQLRFVKATVSRLLAREFRG